MKKLIIISIVLFSMVSVSLKAQDTLYVKVVDHASVIQLPRQVPELFPFVDSPDRALLIGATFKVAHLEISDDYLRPTINLIYVVDDTYWGVGYQPYTKTLSFSVWTVLFRW